MDADLDAIIWRTMLKVFEEDTDHFAKRPTLVDAIAGHIRAAVYAVAARGIHLDTTK